MSLCNLTDQRKKGKKKVKLFSAMYQNIKYIDVYIFVSEYLKQDTMIRYNTKMNKEQQQYVLKYVQ